MTTTCSTSTADAASVLREAMVRELREWGAIRSEPVEQAALTVPRHLFAPGEPIEAAYEPNKPLVVKRDEQGLALSSLSATHIQVVMLEQAAGTGDACAGGGQRRLQRRPDRRDGGRVRHGRLPGYRRRDRRAGPRLSEGGRIRAGHRGAGR